jgi:transposase
LDHKTLEEMRRLAVRQVLDGAVERVVAESLEVHPGTISKWVGIYREGGEEALASRKATGRPPKLTHAQRARVRRIIIGKNPRQLNFGALLWTTRLVGQMIEQLFAVVLDPVTVGRILRDMGISPQKPIRRAFQRDDEECRCWCQEVFPSIVREAKRRQAVLLFVDESGIHEDHPLGRTWGEKGKTPILEVSGKRRRINVISAISPRGRLWFRCYRENLTAPLYVEFLKALLHDIRKPIILVQDRHPAHVAAFVRRFLQTIGKRLTIYELPAYAPNLNPDEHVWTHVKGLFRSIPLDRDESLNERVDEMLRDLQSTPSSVRKFFLHPEVDYVRKALGW